MAIVQESELVVLGDAVDVFIVKVKPSLHGRTLAESGIGAKTGLTVVGIKHNGTVGPVRPSMRLELGAGLVAVGTEEQRRRYEKLS
jgi:K+/H+ antiporter YhaU regulatory subunit KhtT